jgi:hypothetical protein
MNNSSWNFIKNKVLYVCQSGTSGYANAAKGYIYELLNKKIDVKSIQFACDESHKNQSSNFDIYINKTTSIELENLDTTIIHSTPDIWPKLISDLKLNTGVLIGRTVWEFEKLVPEWVDSINNSAVDYVSVPTEWNKTTFIKSGVKKPILVDPHIFVSYPYKRYELEHFLKKKSIVFSDSPILDRQFEDAYKFYSISQLTDRKGVLELVKVFCETYTENDGVILLLKTFRDGHSVEEQKKCIESISETIKLCNNKKYAPIAFIKENLNFDELQSLHDIGDCYISLAKAEGFGLGIFDAFNLNKPIITTKFGGHVEYLGENYDGLVNCSLESVNSSSFPKFNFDESYKWAIVDLDHVSKLMLKNTDNQFGKFLQKNPICIGEGVYDLEHDGKSHFKWISKELDIYVFDNTINSITLHFIAEFEGKLYCNNKEYSFSVGSNNLEITKISPKIKLLQNYFVPSLTYNSSDTRELSYKLYAISLNYKNDNIRTLNIDSIRYITPEYYENLKTNRSLELGGKIVTEYGNYGEMFIKTSKHNPSGKINLNYNQISFYSHRSGWDYALGGLFDLHNNRGIIVDGFLENAFVWRKEEFISKKNIPYRKPWVGFFHNPPNMPTWFSDNSAYPNSILNDKYFKQSLIYCKGLYVLSKYHANFLKVIISHIPINVLYHPTEIPDNKFNFENFIKNNDKSVVNIGWWLRKLNSFYLLNSPYKKVRLLPNNKCKDTIFRLSKVERALYNIELTEHQTKSVNLLDHLSNDDYDKLLTENIIFLDLYDSSANNAIIEAIARATPILINRHPAVIEYLGEDYPFYFNDYNEAENKLKNLDLIRQTHNYLLNFDLRKNIMLETFVSEFSNSEIYQKL